MRHIPAILIFSAILALQLLLIGEVGAGDSEAYYYSWSRNLSLSYYDHPAGIAFLIRISTVIFGHSTFGLRFFSTILINLSLLILYITGNIFYKETKTALIAMLFLISTPAFLIGGVSASPEPPLIFFCSLSLLFFFLFTKTHMTSYLYISFFLSGIGFNIKYSAIFLTAGYFYILIKKNRKLKRELICCAAITLASLLPVILWNLAHKGVSFEYHLIDRVNPLYIPLNILKFAGGQLLYFNPILVIIMISLITREAKGKSENIFK
ncbi:MAG: glycosyltransferase family 39 protein, partial [Deltaproteobacteria bacterium]|nr:glycosyltransferase family 39 protein [Deltaproteobacteria bacterium]